MSYRLFGAETSAYSTKMRSYLKYKAVAFDWVPRTQETEDELKRVSRFATLPVLVTSSGFAVHDTTPLIEALEADSPEPSALPADPALGFLACVLEEYGDSWLAKTVFHYRWTRKKDQRLAAQRTIDDYYTVAPPEDRRAAEDRAIENMGNQLKLMQLDGDLGDVLEKSFKRFVKLLDEHLRKHLFIFGERPSIADFAIAGQLIQMMKDPTPAKIIEKDGAFVAKWCEFMAAPTASGPFAALEDLKETLAPIFADDLGLFFLPWAAENLESSLASAESFTVTLGKDAIALTPIRSAARSFRELRRKFVGGQTVEALKAFTDAAEITTFLLRPQKAAPSVTLTDEAAPATEDDAAPAIAADAEGAPAPEADGEAGEGGPRKRRRRRRSGRTGETATDVEAAGESGEGAPPADATTEDAIASAPSDVAIPGEAITDAEPSAEAEPPAATEAEAPAASASPDADPQTDEEPR